ncbi:uncharacterized protein LOC118186932 [Stegodyphus dumicola]|uniref:uncharacterized protein LOC118186932 n=1 Tax=Stegodyphus dumicola TaxID=202533 RepID=UPI0015AC219A|nr:uncharacterized protein LOC118186932 [Stegodyphus dumicola]
MAEDLTTSDCKLIAEVQQHPILWDNRKKEYRMKRGQDVAWLLVAERLNRDVEEVTYRWQNLRKQYSRRKTKCKSGASAESAEQQWHLMPQMSFLDPCIRHRRTQTNFQGNKEFEELNFTVESVVSESSDNIEYPTEPEYVEPSAIHVMPSCESPLSPASSSRQILDNTNSNNNDENTPRGKKRKKRETIESSLLSVIDETNKYLKNHHRCENDDDDDKLFLLSLHSDLKKND